MGKPFKIYYRPDNWNAPAGGVASAWTTPYGGLHVKAPENMIGPQFSPNLDNIMLRNAELSSRPAFRQLIAGPDETNPILAVGSFLSPNKVWHTFSMTPRGLFQLKTNWATEAPSGRNPWDLLGGPSLDFVPVSWVSLNGILYYTNGQNLSAWDGKANSPIMDVAFTGVVAPPPDAATKFGSVFIGELGNHIILAFVSETVSGVTETFSNRVRWSNSGFNPTSVGGVFGANLGTVGATFDPTVNVNAGLNDLLDVPDIITGLMTLGRTGFIFRQNGITELFPTGKGIAPFDFNHQWASQNGVGNVYPYSIAQYGNTGVFISFEDIYQVGPGMLKAIGGGSRDAIYVDLARASDAPKAAIERGFRLGFSYPIYHLRIPMGDRVRSYIYSFDDENWTRWTSTGVLPTGISNECWV